MVTRLLRDSFRIGGNVTKLDVVLDEILDEVVGIGFGRVIDRGYFHAQFPEGKIL